MSPDASVPRPVSPPVIAIPIRGLDLSMARLPAEHTLLVGRIPEIMGIQALLGRDDVRLLTITGPGGGGKTRVAIGAARRAASHFDEGAAFISLVSIRDPDLVAPAIFQALGGRGRGVDFSVERLHQLFGERALLLILDNFEHLVTAAPVVTNLLAGCPGLTILVTSRVALRLSGEHEFRIPPLSLPDPDQTLRPEQTLQSDAVRLFVQRAQAARSDFEPAPDILAAVAKVCQHLDGLPLAIELAAARVTHLSPAALLERLERPAAARLPLLTGGARDQPARFQTLRDTIAWSYDLLDEAEKCLFQWLSVFPADFSLEAAECVGGDGFALGEVGGCAALGGDGPTGLRTEEDEGVPSSSVPSAASPPKAKPSPSARSVPPSSALDNLASLVAKSLISYEGENGGEPTYGMLETIREFGRERLAASGQEDAARQRHAAWSLALAERAGPHVKGPDAALWLDLLERDHASLRAALGWFVERQDGAMLARMAGALWSFWQEHAHYAEGRRWLESALDLGQDIPPEDRLRLLTGAGALAWYQADVARSRQMHKAALALAQQLGDRVAEAFELGNLGVHASEAGDHALAVARFEASLAAASAAGVPDATVLALFNLAHLDWQHGNGTKARRRLEKALALAREHRMGWILPNIVIGLGTTTLDLGDPERAIGLFQESIALAQARGNLGDVIDGIEGLARVATMTGQAEDSCRLFGATDALREALATPLLPAERDQLEPIVDGLRATLGEARFAASWSAGRALSHEEAIVAALALQSEAAGPPAHGLTERELEVLRLLAAGQSNREIGDLLYISPATAARHVANIYSKLDLDSRARATAFAHEHGIVEGH